ncbi:MAG: hypothetical protein P1U34_03505 [Coxiellaceae bacterium]|nr:hypothetical protein [Coxiellaceae bacterium]
MPFEYPFDPSDPKPFSSPNEAIDASLAALELSTVMKVGQVGVNHMIIINLAEALSSAGGFKEQVVICMHLHQLQQLIEQNQSTHPGVTYLNPEVAHAISEFTKDETLATLDNATQLKLLLAKTALVHYKEVHSAADRASNNAISRHAKKVMRFIFGAATHSIDITSSPFNAETTLMELYDAYQSAHSGETMHFSAELIPVTTSSFSI